jgi:hypothetical protein
MTGLTLSEAIASLRSELQQAMEDGFALQQVTDDDGPELIRFVLGPVQLELEVAATGSAGADGKIGLWRVVAIGAQGERSSSSTHRLNLTLTPQVGGALSAGEVIIGRDLPRRPR